MLDDFLGCAIGASSVPFFSESYCDLKYSSSSILNSFGKLFSVVVVLAEDEVNPGVSGTAVFDRFKAVVSGSVRINLRASALVSNGDITSGTEVVKINASFSGVGNVSVSDLQVNKRENYRSHKKSISLLLSR